MANTEARCATTAGSIPGLASLDRSAGGLLDAACQPMLLPWQRFRGRRALPAIRGGGTSCSLAQDGIGCGVRMFRDATRA